MTPLAHSPHAHAPTSVSRIMATVMLALVPATLFTALTGLFTFYLGGFYERNRVPIFGGSARFIDPHTIELLEAKGAEEKLTADHFVIATGSRPYHPADVDFQHPRIFDSDTILKLGFTPRSIAR